MKISKHLFATTIHAILTAICNGEVIPWEDNMDVVPASASLAPTSDPLTSMPTDAPTTATPTASSAPTPCGIDWPEFYSTDPNNNVRDLHVKIKSSDLTIIKNDGTFDIEVPCMLWEGSCPNEPPVLVSIRRKSADPMGTLPKLSYKIDINEYKYNVTDGGVRQWHGVKKLSLENGDNSNVVTEQLAWQMQKIAAEEVGYYSEGYVPGMSNFASLTFHIVEGNGNPDDIFNFDGSETVENQGVYLSAEQIDESALKNRNDWVKGLTWMMFMDDANVFKLKETGCSEFDPLEEEPSPTTKMLECYPLKPFADEANPCDPQVISDLYDLDTWLGVAAMEAFIGSYDGMLTKGKNFHFVDYAYNTTGAQCPDVLPDPSRKRVHYEWDLDATFRASTVGTNIYSTEQPNRGRERRQLTTTTEVFENAVVKTGLRHRNLAGTCPDGTTCTSNEECGTICIGGADAGASCTRSQDCSKGGKCLTRICEGITASPTTLTTEVGSPAPTPVIAACTSCADCTGEKGRCIFSGCDWTNKGKVCSGTPTSGTSSPTPAVTGGSDSPTASPISLSPNASPTSDSPTPAVTAEPTAGDCHPCDECSLPGYKAKCNDSLLCTWNGGPKNGNCLFSGDGGGGNLNQSPLQKWVFGHQDFLDLYNAKMGQLTARGADKVIDKACAYLSELETTGPLKALLEADPNSRNAETGFTALCQWLKDRGTFAESQICGDTVDQQSCSTA